MSRVGKLPISVPSDVNVSFQSNVFLASGKLGELSISVPESISLEIKESDTSDDNSSDSGNSIVLSLKEVSSKSQPLWGTINKLIGNAVLGVSKGFEKRLTIKGTGYKSSVSENYIRLSLGYSHDIIYSFSNDVKVRSEGSELIVSSYDKQKVGQVCGEIIAFRPVEPYKGKGIYITGSVVRRKEGKKK